LVPANAIQQHGQVASVYVVQDGIARLRLIQVGLPTAAGVEVLAGLDVGESVVTSPTARVADGARVAVGAARKVAGGTP
jgi:HlyD family secretion protein